MLDKTNDDDEFDEVDMEALRRAMGTVMKDKSKRAYFVDQLTDTPWTNVATLAAYQCQIKELQLRSWEDPPCHGGDDDSQANATALLKRLLAAGLSRWEPDPLVALALQEPIPDVPPSTST